MSFCSLTDADDEEAEDDDDLEIGEFCLSHSLGGAFLLVDEHMANKEESSEAVFIVSVLIISDVFD